MARDISSRRKIRFLDEDLRSAVAYFQQEPLGTANIEAALKRLSQSMYRDRDRTPLSIFGSYGLDGNDAPYMNVLALNEHRETSALWLLFHREEGEKLMVRITLPLDEKEVEMVLQHFLNIEPVSWQEFLVDSKQQQSTVIEVTATVERFVHLPLFDGCVVAAAAEDRLNGLGNFVPLTEKDWPR